jgi:phosphatidylcholine synthase
MGGNIQTGSGRSGTLAALGIHFFTASGAALAVLAALAVMREEWVICFAWLGAALVVDGIDGPLARKMGVQTRVPWIDGAVLDLVVDYSTYVFVPALILARSHLLPGLLGDVAAVLVSVVGAIYFADQRMKTPQNAFRGFPAVWNMAVFVLVAVGPPAWLSILVLALCGVLSFAPVEFVHPVRVRQLRPLTLAVAAVWGVFAIAALFMNLEPTDTVRIGLTLTTIYLAGIGPALQMMRIYRP